MNENTQSRPASGEDVVIVGAACTPQGKLLGQLAALSAVELGATAITGALGRAGVAAEDVIAVMDALEGQGYEGYVTFEYFHPYQHYPEALIYQTSDSLDRMLGRTTG